MSSRYAFKVLAGLLSAWVMHTQAAAPVWFVDPVNLYHVDAERVALQETIPLRSTRAVAATAEGSAWVLTATALQRWDSGKDGARMAFSLPLERAGIGNPRLLRVSPSDGTVWVAGETHAWHIGRDGANLGSYLASEPIRDIAVGWDRTLWVLGAKTLRQIEAPSSEARVAKAILLEGHPEVPDRIAMDLLHHSVWLGGKRWLSRVDLGNDAARLDLPLPADALAFDIAPQNGALWVLTPKAFIAYGHAGDRRRAVALPELGVTAPQAFAVDPSGEFLWVTHRSGITRIHAERAAAAALALPQPVRLLPAVAAAPFSVKPTLALKAPPAQAAIAGTTEFSFEVDAVCAHGACTLPPEYFGTMDLRAALNGASLGVLPVDPATHRASAVAGQLSGQTGSVSLEAQATDAFGGQSRALRQQFTAAANATLVPGTPGEPISTPVRSSATRAAAVDPNQTPPPAAPAPLTAEQQAAAAAWSNALSRLPLTFEANRGQHASQVDYVSRGRGYRLYLAQGEAVLRVHKRLRGKDRPHAGRFETKAEAADQAIEESVRLRFQGAKPRPKATPEDQLVTRSNYLTSEDPRQWRTDVPHYAKVRYTEVYPGIDQVYYGKDGQLEYDWIVRPGADYQQIQQQFEGARGLTLNAQGDLVVALEAGDLLQHKPVAYQEVGGQRREVSAKYVLLADNKVGFSVGQYDRTLPLVIDPVLSYATYLGGSGDDAPTSIAVDSSGNLYIAGSTTSLSDFPVAPNNTSPRANVFVAKLSAAGDQLLYTTFFTRTTASHTTQTISTSINAIAVDGQGQAYIGGVAFKGFPTTTGAAQKDASIYTWAAGTCPSCTPDMKLRPNGFVAKLNAQGNGLVYATFIDGGMPDINGFNGKYWLWTQVRGLALGPDGSVYAVGETDSPNFPTTTGAYRRTKATTRTDVVNAFVARLNPAGSNWIYSTYLGGSGPYPNYEGKYTATPVPEVISGDVARSVAVDASGNAYVGGSTISYDFPVTSNALQSTRKGILDGFLSKLSADGTNLLYSSLIGGGATYNADYALQELDSKTGYDFVVGVKLDGAGKVYLAGITNSLDFPVSAQAYKKTLGTADKPFYSSGIPRVNYWLANAFVTQLDLGQAPAQQMGYSTYFGGNGCLGTDCIGLWEYHTYAERTYALDVDAAGNATIVGSTRSDNFERKGWATPVGPLRGRSPFVAQFDVNGNLRYAFQVSAGTPDTLGNFASGVAVGPNGSVYVAGAISDETMYASSSVLQPRKSASQDAFVMKIDNDGPARISISAAPSPSTPDQTVTIAVNISGGDGPYTGEISWCDGDVCYKPWQKRQIGGNLTVVDSTIRLPVGQHNLTARYKGDGINPDLVSAVKVHTVRPPAGDLASPPRTTTTTLYTNRATASVNQNVELSTSVVADACTSSGALPGYLTYYDGDKVLGKSERGYSLTARFATTGTHALRAFYSGDACGTSGWSQTINFVVDASNPQVTLLSPALGTRIQAGGNIPVYARVQVAPGKTVRDVILVVDGQQYAVPMPFTPPHRMTWPKDYATGNPTPAPAGTYTFSVLVTDNTGASTESAPVTVEVVAPTALGHRVTYLHNDVTSSAVAATNESAQVLWNENYRPYGQRMNRELGATFNRQFFHGKPEDSSGLQYFGARYYDPVLGRFMGADPMGYTEGDWHGFNRYAFANNNPYRYTDPDGNSPLDLIFLGADVVKLGIAVYSGNPAAITEGLIDVAISTAGVISPVPGLGQAAKMARAADKVADAARIVGHVAEQARVAE